MRKISLLVFALLTLWLLPQSQTTLLQASAVNTAKPTGAGWQQIQKLLPDLIEEEESLGRAIALTDDTLVIANQAGDRVHVYTRPGAFWQEVAFLQRSGAPILRPIAVATDGETVVVGYEEAVYVYQKPVGGWQTMTETAVLTASDHELNDDFGVAVAVDGDTIVVGAPLDRYDAPPNGAYGSVYVFVRSGSTWTSKTETAKLTADEPGNLDKFGTSVAIAGNTVAIGAQGADGSETNSGGVYIFVEPAGGWHDTSGHEAFLMDSDGQLGAGLGISVAINSSGTVVAAGEYRDDEFVNQGGAINVFVRLATGWADMTESAKLTPETPLEGENLGRSVAIRGERIIAGADGLDAFLPGAAYLFIKPGLGWIGDVNEVQRFTADDSMEGDGFGAAVAIADDLIVVGGPYRQEDEQYTGAAYLFSTTAVAFDHFIFLPLITE